MGRAYEVRKASIQKTGAARGKIYSMYAREIYEVAKNGGTELESNVALKRLVDKAKKEQVPSDIIKRAIDKVNSGADESYSTVRYELFGPSGSNVIVDCLTDNRNRTASLVRSSFTKKGGNLGTDGSVSYLFERKGVIILPKTYDEDMIMTLALDNDALDFVTNDDSYEIYVEPGNFIKMNKVLEDNNITDIIMNEIRYIPTN